MHPTAEWLRAAAEEASATPPPHQEQRGRPGSARELANLEAISPAASQARWRRRCTRFSRSGITWRIVGLNRASA